MSTQRLLAVIGALAIGGLGCTHTVEAAFARDADFSRFHRWEFRPGHDHLISVPEARPDRVGARIAGLIRSGLDEKGYARASEAPDFYVTYELIVEKTLESVRVPQAAYLMASKDSSPSYWIGATDTEQRRVDHARLAIEIYDRAGEVVWKGAYRDRLEHGRELDLEAAVRELLARFPEARERVQPRVPGPTQRVPRETASIPAPIGVI